MVAAGFLLLTAWVLGVAAVVVLAAQKLGTAGALLAVTAGLVLLALILVWGTRARNRTQAAERASTRALWAATAVNAASMILRRDAQNTPASSGAEASAGVAGGGASGSHRSTLLIVGGLALILLAFLFPSGKDEGPEAGPGDPECDPESDPDTAA